jgi:hypothetical protein
MLDKKAILRTAADFQLFPGPTENILEAEWLPLPQ